jgi:hypothetical protein
LREVEVKQRNVTTDRFLKLSKRLKDFLGPRSFLATKERVRGNWYVESVWELNLGNFGGKAGGFRYLY